MTKTSVNVVFITRNYVEHLRIQLPHLRSNLVTIVQDQSNAVKTILDSVHSVRGQSVHENWINDRL